MENAELINNQYYVSLGYRLKMKSEEFRHTVHLNSGLSGSKVVDEEGSKRAFKMKLIHPKQIVARGQNQKVIEVLQHKECNIVS